MDAGARPGADINWRHSEGEGPSTLDARARRSFSLGAIFCACFVKRSLSQTMHPGFTGFAPYIIFT